MSTQVSPAEEEYNAEEAGNLRCPCCTFNLTVCWPHSDYVPLLRRAYELWHDLEAESDQVPLFPRFICLNMKA